MNNPIVKSYVIPTAVLTVLCLIISAALAFTNSLTAPLIAANQDSASNEARAEIFPDAGGFEQVKIDMENIVDAYKTSDDSGYIITAKQNGYGGDVPVMVGISAADHTIVAIKILGNNETAGIGSQIEEESYTSQYVGMDGSLSGVDSISGATVSSTACRGAVELAFKAYAELTGADVPDAAAPDAGGSTGVHPGLSAIFPDTTTMRLMLPDVDAELYLAEGAGIVVATQAKGYSETEDVTVYTGFGADGTIAGIYMGPNGETDGIGTKVNEEAFRSQFAGKSDTADIDAVSGATMTSMAVLRGVNAALEILPAIQPYLDQIAMAKYTAVLPGAASINAIEVDGTLEAYEAKDAGYIFVVNARGYNQDQAVELMVGIGNDGIITGVAVVGAAETAGIGSQALEQSHLSQFVGQDSAEGVDAISGATVTSDAVRNAVNKALTAYDTVKGAD